jgi:outer membrane protein assembly factor BamD (BamD/ComL family)
VSPAPGDDPSGEAPRPVRTAHSTPRPNAAAPKEIVENARASQLREESEMILGARRVLRAGDPLRALTLLDAARARFPEGILVQEREALSIEALVRSGQRALATKRAESFLRAYPKSPHGADVKRVVLEP